MDIILLPTFGCFSPSKKECVISFDGKYPSSLESVYRIGLIININQDNLMKTDSVSWIQIENRKMDDSDSSIIELITNMVDEYNIILHTENKDILQKLIKNDLYGFGGESVGLSSHDSTKNLEEWRDFVLNNRTDISNL